MGLALLSVGMFGASQREGVQPSAAPRRELSEALGAEKTEGRTEEQLVRIGKRVSSVETLLGDLQALAHTQANDTAALKQQLASVARLGQLAASQRVEAAIPKPEPPVAVRPMLDRPVAAAPSPSRSPAASPSRSPAALPSRSPPPSPSRSPSSVHVWFIYDANAQLGPAVDLYWLSGNSSERWYATIPAGQRADEHTYAGQCWRARTVRARGGQHVASYCATSEPTQQVHITPQSKVQLDFHYPHLPGSSSLAKLSKFGSSNGAPGVAAPPRASVYQLIGTPPHDTETLVGHVNAGGHLSTSALAGSRLRVRDEATRRPLLPLVVAGAEAEQHIDISASHVTLEFELSPGTANGDGAAIYWTWGDTAAFAREHLYAELHRGHGSPMVRVASPAGEQWIVRRASKPGEGSYGAEELLLTVTAKEAPAVQRAVIAVPHK
jgi:hypothetical protein